MNNFIKQTIEEKFTSKAQQRFFYAKANEKGKPKKEKKKWQKWAKGNSDETDFENLPEKVKSEVEGEVDEIIDDKGNIQMGKKPTDFNKRGITQKKMTDQVVKTGAGSMGIHGVHGTHTSLRYWAESDMSKVLGYDETLGKDEDIEDAKKHYEKELGVDDAEERMAQIGYDPELPDEKVRLVENPKKFVEEYIESILSKKTKFNDIVEKDSEEIQEKEINPIIQKQIRSLKNSMSSNNLTVKDIVRLLKKDE